MALDEALVAAALSRPTPISGTTRTGVDEIDRRIGSVELKGGLAAGPRWVEAQQLQIAWEPDLTTVVSDGGAALLQEIWRTAQEVEDFADSDASEISTVEQLHELLEAARAGISDLFDERDDEIGRAARRIYAAVQIAHSPGSVWGSLLFYPEASEFFVWAGVVIVPYAATFAADGHARRHDHDSIWRIEGRAPVEPSLETLQALLATAVPDGATRQTIAAELRTQIVANRETWIFDYATESNSLKRAADSAQIGAVIRAGVAGRYESAILERLTSELAELEAFISEPYAFDVFAPATTETPRYNFGVILTYQQIWLRLDYQAGELVATVPLAPGESRKYEVKTSVKETRSQKEMKKNLTVTKDDTELGTKAEEDIQRRTKTLTNFQNEGGGLAGSVLGGTSTFGINQESESAGIKKRMRELRSKATREVRSERTLHVETTESISSDYSQTTEIRNPNDELAVTFLFYELEQRFAVAERFDRAEAVILIPFEVPTPVEVDEDWLIRHSWILRRTLLDDELIRALDYVVDDHALLVTHVETARVTLEQRRHVFDEVGAQLEGLTRSRTSARSRLVDVVGTAEGQDSFLVELGEFIFGGTSDDEDVRASQIEARQKALDYLDGDIARTRSEVAAAGDELRAASATFAGVSGRLTQGLAWILQLRAHVRQNILFYMQAIWWAEVPDQRYMRLYDMEIATGARYRRVDSGTMWMDFGPLEGADVGIVESSPLHEIADLDALVGFKGNYAIFPLKDDLEITDTVKGNYFQLSGESDDDPGWRDPAGETELAGLLHDAVLKWGHSSYETRTEMIEQILRSLSTAESTEYDIVVVPSGQTMIELLVGESTLMEDFKLRHREIDAEKAAHEADELRLENLRLAARLLADTPVLGDPKTESTVYLDTDLDHIPPPS